MKQILRLGESYGLSPVKRYILYALLIAICTFLLPGGFAQAQSTNIEDLGIPEGGLKIGDSIPEALWHLPLQVVNHPEGKDTITLNDYRGKLIILDFWATWCTNCIAAMPRMHELQQQFTDSLIILATTYEPSDKARDFLNSNKTVKHLRVMSIVNDAVFTSLFPHRLIPHYAWISTDGIATATTSTAEVNALTISKIINGDGVSLNTKRDIDTNRPLFSAADYPADQLMGYSIFLKGYVNGIGSGNNYRTKGDTVCGRLFKNMPLLDIIRICTRNAYVNYSPKNQIIEVAHPERLFKPGQRGQLREWVKQNACTYELTVPPANADSLYTYLLAGIDRFSDYHVSVVNKETAVLELFVADGHLASQMISTLPADKNHMLNDAEKGVELQHLEIRHLVHVLDEYPHFLPVLDITDIQEPVTIRLKPPVQDLACLNKQLQAYGLGIRESRAQMPFLKISDK